MGLLYSINRRFVSYHFPDIDESHYRHNIRVFAETGRQRGAYQGPCTLDDICAST